MTKKFTDESWQNLVPDVYRWVDGVHFETGNDANFQGVIVVPVRAKNDDKGVLQRELLCGASLPKDVQDALARAWASSAWVAKSGVLTLA
jgi:hypothetical protein